MIVRSSKDRRQVVPVDAAVRRVKREEPAVSFRHEPRNLGQREEYRLAVGQKGDLRIAAIDEGELVTAPNRSTVARCERRTTLARMDGLCGDKYSARALASDPADNMTTRTV
jgi:hypothetical protein